jgi:hypothetical protein
LITAHAQQLQSEESKLRINISEKEKFESDIRDYGKKIVDIDERKRLQKIC